MFNAEKHFLSKQKKSSNSEANPRTLQIWLGNTPHTQKSKVPQTKEPEFPYKNITEKSAQELQMLFLKYIQQMKAENRNTAMVGALYKMELIGAPISAIKHREDITEKESLRKGVVVNETKNTLAIAYAEAVKIFPKAMYNFIIYVDGAKYFIIGAGLKSERRYAK
ncbi:hypothetical protein NERG_01870 [Nematocida ausubeli]|uniref:Uncharacterized protein n=1 Tax=Nematocida ausubeli (strain ATCC PRA-371 / ERTm2) TaxID=1913371 RepID=H8ZE49_NEMA1|nr:hypothetical protein NERG_01870 [Nematocida ausubeli]